jgi:hypothetical protein
MKQTSQFEHLKKRLAKQAQEDGTSYEDYSPVHAQVAATGGSFERIKRRLNIKQKAHEATELHEDGTGPIKHMPPPQANAIIDYAITETPKNLGGLEHPMMNTNTGAPFAVQETNELTLDEAMLMEDGLSNGASYNTSNGLNNDALLDLELQESHSAATKSVSQSNYSSVNGTFTNNNNQEPSAPMNAHAPTMATEQRKVPQLSVDNFGDTQPHDSAEYTSNVKTLIKLINELPEGVTKQTGAQIIRFTMEAMGIAMEEVLSEAQSTQSEMLDAVRGNIKKIEEYKTVIRKLESDIKFYQGKANELSEIIDLFILSSSSIKSHSDI